jgi:hypothetical protein
MSAIYYKLYKRENGLITIVCLQWFDEGDYYANNFVKDSSNEAHSFDTEDEAKEKLNEWFKPEQIDPEYRVDPDLIRD